jgi:ATP-binding cassette subfamily B (MDR/TAP) protein 1
MLHRDGCSDNDESEVYPLVCEEVAEILASQDEEAQETRQEKDKHYSLAPTLSGVRPVTMAIGG